MTSPGEPAAAARSAKPVRTWIVRTTIAAFSLAALMGIVALLRPGSFGETEGRVLLTTLLVGTVSIAVLCYLATSGRRSQPVGVVGGVAVLVPLVTALVMIWGDWEHGPSEGVIRTFGVGTVAAATLAQACLLLVLGERGTPAVRRTIWTTLGLATVLAVMVSVLILGFNPHGDGYTRVLGVVGILDVLGTVVAAALAKFGPGSDRDDDQRSTFVALPPALMAAVHEEEARTGVPAGTIVAEAVEFHLGRRSQRHR